LDILYATICAKLTLKRVITNVIIIAIDILAKCLLFILSLIYTINNDIKNIGIILPIAEAILPIPNILFPNISNEYNKQEAKNNPINDDIIIVLVLIHCFEPNINPHTEHFSVDSDISLHLGHLIKAMIISFISFLVFQIARLFARHVFPSFL
jgi:hypothetical protein